jgi:very-short-patch-repair endonuclease
MYKNHKPNCQCPFCRTKRGEYKGKNSPNYGTHHTTSEETIQKIIKANTGKKRTDEQKRKNGEGHKGIHHSEEFKKNHSEVSIKLWQNPEYREKTLKAMFKSFNIKPNGVEQFLNSILQDLFPNQYKYVGDGSILIGYKNPDFINIAGQRIIIELFGDHWHSKQITGRNRIEEERQRTKHFARYGYQTLIIWEHELKDIEKLKNKLLEFIKL